MKINRVLVVAAALAGSAAMMGCKDVSSDAASNENESASVDGVVACNQAGGADTDPGTAQDARWGRGRGFNRGHLGFRRGERRGRGRGRGGRRAWWRFW